MAEKAMRPVGVMSVTFWSMRLRCSVSYAQHTNEDTAGRFDQLLRIHPCVIPAKVGTQASQRIAHDEIVALLRFQAPSASTEVNVCLAPGRRRDDGG
jgi:hypothetical protein